MKADIFGFNIRLSEVMLLLSGVALLISLPYMTRDNTSLWDFSKLLYGVGVVLFIFDR